MKSFPHNQVDEEPGQAQAAHQLPLDPAQAVLQAGVGHQHSVTTERERGAVRVWLTPYVQYSSTGVFTSVRLEVVVFAVELKLIHFSVFHQASEVEKL